MIITYGADREIRVVVKQKQSGQEAQSFSLLTGVPLNARFDFTLSDTGDGTMVFSAGYAGNTHRVTAQVPDAFRGETVRFQVGDYQQADVAQARTMAGGSPSTRSTSCPLGRENGPPALACPRYRLPGPVMVCVGAPLPGSKAPTA